MFTPSCLWDLLTPLTAFSTFLLQNPALYCFKCSNSAISLFWLQLLGDGLVTNTWCKILHFFFASTIILTSSQDTSKIDYFCAIETAPTCNVDLIFSKQTGTLGRGTDTGLGIRDLSKKGNTGQKLGLWDKIRTFLGPLLDLTAFWTSRPVEEVFL